MLESRFAEFFFPGAYHCLSKLSVSLKLTQSYYLVYILGSLIKKLMCFRIVMHRVFVLFACKQ